MLRNGTFVWLLLPADDRLDPCEPHESQDPLVVNRPVRVSTELDAVPSVAVNTSDFCVKGEHLLH
ncbi:hypothetical protein D3C80_1884410 [compost metagenome]